MATKLTVWVLSACIPDESRPCFPMVYATEAEARKAFDDVMREEWEVMQPYDDEDVETLLPYPESPEEAVEVIADQDAEGKWGRWELTSHQIDVA